MSLIQDTCPRGYLLDKIWDRINGKKRADAADWPNGILRRGARPLPGTAHFSTMSPGAAMIDLDKYGVELVTVARDREGHPIRMWAASDCPTLFITPEDSLAEKGLCIVFSSGGYHIEPWSG